MMTLLKYKLGLIAAVSLLLISSANFAFAESVDSNAALFQEVERLRLLKQSDPAAYREIIASKQNKVKSRYENLKTKNPEKFQKFLNQDKSKKRKRLQKMKQNNPQAFEQFVNHRTKRLQKLEQKNPEKFQKLMKRRPEFSKRFQNQRRQSEGDQARASRFQKQGKNGQAIKREGRLAEWSDRRNQGESNRFQNQRKKEIPKRLSEMKREPSAASQARPKNFLQPQRTQEGVAGVGNKPQRKRPDAVKRQGGALQGTAQMREKNRRNSLGNNQGNQNSKRMATGRKPARRG